MSNRLHIDGQRALELLREVVAEHGTETVYQQVPVMGSDGSERLMCVYAHDGQPSCLIGHALHRAGVTVDELAALQGVADELDDVLPARVDLDPLAESVFYAAQFLQDDGSPWGEALTAAEEAAVEWGGVS
jgi:hypothetical protein